MNIKKTMEVAKADIIGYFLNNILAALKSMWLVCIIIVVIITLEGLVAEFTLVHNITYFLISLLIPTTIIAIVSGWLGAMYHYSKGKFPYKKFSIYFTDDGYRMQNEGKKDDVLWCDVFNFILLKKYIYIMPMYGKTMYESGVVLPTSYFTDNELMEIDMTLSSKTEMRNKYKKSNF